MAEPSISRCILAVDVLFKHFDWGSASASDIVSVGPKRFMSPVVFFVLLGKFFFHGAAGCGFKAANERRD